jgi:predicted CoA-binding protein
VALPDHVTEILAMRPLPRVVWFQLGIRNDEVAAALAEAGITVVQDRCTLAEHKRLHVARR